MAFGPPFIAPVGVPAPPAGIGVEAPVEPPAALVAVALDGGVLFVTLPQPASVSAANAVTITAPLAARLRSRNRLNFIHQPYRSGAASSRTSTARVTHEGSGA